MSIELAQKQVLSFATLLDADQLVSDTADGVDLARAALKTAQKTAATATFDARMSRRTKLVELHTSVEASDYTRDELVQVLKHRRDVEKLPMPEDFDYKSNSDITYAWILGALFSLPFTSKDDLPADVVIADMHNVLKHVPSSKTTAMKIINTPNQTIRAAWAEIEQRSADARAAKAAKSKTTKVAEQTTKIVSADGSDTPTAAGHIDAAHTELAAGIDLLNTDPAQLTDDLRTKLDDMRSKIEMLLGADTLADKSVKVTAPAQRVAA